MKHKQLWFDTETTGTDAFRHDIIQVAGIIIIDGEEVDSFNLRCKPRDFKSIEPQALEIQGLTVKDLESFPDPYSAYTNLLSIFETHISKFDKQDKFTPAGHNVQFDLNFLQSFFKKAGNKFGTGSYQNWQSIDTLALARVFKSLGHYADLPDLKLGTLANFYGIEIKAHDALSDIRVTYQIFQCMKKHLSFTV